MKTVAILYGGPSSEYEVSVRSGVDVIEYIDRECYRVLPVHITKTCVYEIEGKEYQEKEALTFLSQHADLVFPVLHGKYGEGGILQAKLESLHVLFVGSSSEVSALAMNKHRASEVFVRGGLSVPQEKVITKEEYTHSLRYPIICKPVDEGSSVGLSIVTSEKEFLDSKDKLFLSYDTLLAQEYIAGREFTCAVIQKGSELIPLLASEVILTNSTLLDYDAKYTKGGCQKVTPAEVDEVLMQRIQDTAIRCHKLLGCRSLSRTDTILAHDTLYVLETNTIPGMTKTSFLPAQAQASGISMKELITFLVESVPIGKVNSKK